jgi:serine/threonine-protein kinase
MIIGERYALERKIGEGAMGAVWLGRHLMLGTAVAVKLIRREALERNPNALRRFEREAVTAARIKSSHVVKVIDHGYHDELPYMVMEYLEGESLRTRLSERRRLSLEETALIVRHVARALTQAHAAGLVHRDIKPENIFITPGEEEQQELVKVLDFGIAKVTDELMGQNQVTTRTGAFLGTPHYMSPEQAYGLKSVGPKSDLWSLGVVAFECLTGTRPFRAPSLAPLIALVTRGPIPVPSTMAPEAGIPPTLDGWVARALAREDKDRFDNARAMAEAFAAAAGVSFGATTSPSYMDRSRASGQNMPLANVVTVPQAEDTLPQRAEIPPAPPTQPMAVPPVFPHGASPMMTSPLMPPPQMPPHGYPQAPMYGQAPMHPQAAATVALSGYDLPIMGQSAAPSMLIETAEPVSHNVSSQTHQLVRPQKASLAVPAIITGAIALAIAAGAGAWLARPSADTETAASAEAPAASAPPATSEQATEEPTADAPTTSASAPEPTEASAKPKAPARPGPSKPQPASSAPAPSPAPTPWKHRRTL